MIQKMSNDDFTAENFKFGTGKNVKIKDIKVWAQRISYVGEIGFELYVSKENALDLYKILINEGKNFNLSHCGMHAMDIMRMESGFLHWGHDISPEENQYEAGLKFTISYKKNINFIGKDALLKIKDKGLDKTMMMFTLKDNKPGQPLLLHEEPIYLEDKIIGRTTSGNYSFCFDKNLSFGYVNSGSTINVLKNKNLFIEVEKIKYPIEVLLKPLNTRDYKNI
jgi:Glycine cleavage system T protein (aminomethyltransferase)